MDILEGFKQYIKKEDLFQTKDTLLLAVSGGVDSVVLCELCNRAGYNFSIAHCNFKLRGADSDRDENFVKALAGKYNVEFFVRSFDTKNISQERKKSIEETARDLRYEWFNMLATDQGQQTIGSTEQNLINSGLSSAVGRHYILTAHHADDNIETVLMNFFRGTGIRGLHGILPKQKNLIRPLLFAKKAELIDFANENKLSFVTDITNAESDFTRNYFRNILIPGVEKIFPKTQQNILNNIERFNDVELLYQQAIDLHKKKLIEPKGKEVHIPLLKLLKAKPLGTIVYEIIKDFGFTALQTDDVMSLLKAEVGKYVQSGTHRIINNRKWLIISPNKTIEASNILIEAADKKITFSAGSIDLKELSITNYQLSTDANVAMLDASHIKFPLLLRKWKQGDYFYPLGMKKKKKVNRFLSDQKLSVTQKENVWVLEMDKKIIWVVGMRIDDRFKITERSENILKLTLSVS